ncbi:uncharacterized protein LOC124838525 [Vigna umbellata]|uniref:uncharacterized protein LOC124838525 n=1 Tax=Vigna umbellata TaxID=87088 RepID=UPI001F5F6709|nr:uncharacterized protein LOC124838525 [Vigna umbellata]
MSSYAKFLKELLTKKRKYIEKETIEVQGELEVGRALIDLGASINLMSLSMFKRIEDRSLKYPYGVVEDVLVKVDKFVFLVDLVIMEMEENEDVPLILGRPFMKTGRVLIDVENYNLKVRVQDKEVNFDVFKAMTHPKDDKACFQFDMLDEVCMVQEKMVRYSSSLEKTLVDACEDLNEEEEKLIDECMTYLQLLKEIPVEEATFEKIDTKEEVKEKNLELKMLPSHLKYAFLEEDGAKPVIVSNSLLPEEEEKLVEILKANKEVIRWSILDLKGISPTYCMHKIFMEEDYRPVAQPQRWLNPVMKEVVRKEVLKLLEAGIIYPISDSEWMSPVQVVPKKGGMTVIYNDKNELIPTRTVTGWRMCIATRKDHFPLPFMDQMLERLAGHAFYCFLDGYFGYNQIVAIFMDIIEKCIEVFMDDFSVFGDSFQRRFIKDFSKIAKPLSNLLVKDVSFVMNEECLKAFDALKSKLVSALVVVALDWNRNFELMCDASDYTIGVVLGQRKKKVFHIIYYASKVLNDAQLNYATTEKEFLVIVYALEKFRPYLIGSKVIIYTDHAAIKYLLTKPDSKPRLIR